MEHSKGKVAVTHSHGIKSSSSNISPSYQLHQRGTYENDCKTMQANCKRIEAFWNAFDGISTHDAVNLIHMALAMKEASKDVPVDQIEKYIRHGAEMEDILKDLNKVLDAGDRDLILAELAIVLVATDKLLQALESEVE